MLKIIILILFFHYKPLIFFIFFEKPKDISCFPPKNKTGEILIIIIIQSNSSLNNKLIELFKIIRVFENEDK